MPEIRRVGPDDAAMLRTTRLRALADAPDAFGVSFDVAAARESDFWLTQASGRLGDQPCGTWLAVDPATGEATGMLTGVDAVDHAEIIQVWVAPAARGTGLVDALFAEALRWSPHRRVDIAVAADNERAHRAYVRLGFVDVGVREVAGRTEIEMSRSL